MTPEQTLLLATNPNDADFETPWQYPNSQNECAERLAALAESILADKTTTPKTNDILKSKVFQEVWAENTKKLEATRQTLEYLGLLRLENQKKSVPEKTIIPLRLPKPNKEKCGKTFLLQILQEIEASTETRARKYRFTATEVARAAIAWKNLPARTKPTHQTQPGAGKIKTVTEQHVELLTPTNNILEVTHQQGILLEIQSKS